MMYIGVTNGTNIATTRIEKIQRYTNLAVEVKTLWGLRKVEIVPIIIGATGFCYNSMDEDLKELGLKNSLTNRWRRKQFCSELHILSDLFSK